MKIEISAGKQGKKIEDYEVESAIQTLIRAKEIQANGELMALVKRKAKSMKAAISSIADLKNAYAQMATMKEGLKPEEDMCRSEEELDFEEEVQDE